MVRLDLFTINERHKRDIWSMSRDKINQMMCGSLSSIQRQGTTVLRAVFNPCLNTGSDGDDETKGGKLLRTLATVTGNARSPIVDDLLRPLK